MADLEKIEEGSAGVFQKLLEYVDNVVDSANILNSDQYNPEEDPFWALDYIRKQHRYLPTATLSNKIIRRALKNNPNLREAIFQAKAIFEDVAETNLLFLEMSEKDLVQSFHSNILSFYSEESASPYVPLAAKGPWIVTFHGGVVYDTGGYGMLGFGHNPDFLKETLSKDQVMANVMTRSMSQYRFTRALINKIREGKECPYTHFAFMNSGSESVAVAARVADAHAKHLVANGAKHQGKKIKYLALKNGFHGRTYRAAQASSSTYKSYKSLASFNQTNKLVTVEANNLEELNSVFQQAKNDNVYFELMLMEPVMGEGRAGYSITPEFYNLARKLTKESNTLLLVDSIQAGLRCNGVISILDYPGFENSAAPDFETFSKALNSGQFPLSVLALGSEAASYYVPGTYGNTMTGNPRALDVGTAIIENLTPDVSRNIMESGKKLEEALLKLQREFPDIIEEVLGQGLLISARLNENYPVEGRNGIEELIRSKGINVIHGSGNRLRFTPWFLLNEKEIRIICKVIREALHDFKRF